MLQTEVKLQASKNKKTLQVIYKINLPKNWVESHPNLQPKKPVKLTYTGTTIIIDLEK